MPRPKPTHEPAPRRHEHPRHPRCPTRAHRPTPIPPTTTDAALILHQIEEETATQFHDRNIQLHIILPPTLPIKGDPTLLYSLFRNIFSNTLTHATHATYFHVQAKATATRYHFTFTDNGPGAPPQHLPHIFERFYRIDKGRTRRLGGTGLGLAIVKNIALQYRGTATATPPPGGGLTIHIELRI